MAWALGTGYSIDDGMGSSQFGMENGPFIEDLPLKSDFLYSYIKIPGAFRGYFRSTVLHGFAMGAAITAPHFSS